MRSGTRQRHSSTSGGQHAGPPRKAHDQVRSDPVYVCSPASALQTCSEGRELRLRHVVDSLRQAVPFGRCGPVNPPRIRAGWPSAAGTGEDQQAGLSRPFGVFRRPDQDRAAEMISCGPPSRQPQYRVAISKPCCHADPSCRPRRASARIPDRPRSRVLPYPGRDPRPAG